MRKLKRSGECRPQNRKKYISEDTHLRYLGLCCSMLLVFSLIVRQRDEVAGEVKALGDSLPPGNQSERRWSHT